MSRWRNGIGDVLVDDYKDAGAQYRPHTLAVEGVQAGSATNYRRNPYGIYWGTAAGMTPVTGGHVLKFCLFWVPEPMVFDVNIGVLTAQAGTAIRLGIYSAGGYGELSGRRGLPVPRDLIEDHGTVDSTTTGGKTTSGSATVPRGWCFGAAAFASTWTSLKVSGIADDDVADRYVTTDYRSQAGGQYGAKGFETPGCMEVTGTDYTSALPSSITAGTVVKSYQHNALVMWLRPT